VQRNFVLYFWWFHETFGITQYRQSNGMTTDGRRFGKRFEGCGTGVRSYPGICLDEMRKTTEIISEDCRCMSEPRAFRWADPHFKESYRLCTGLRNWKRGQGLSKGWIKLNPVAWVRKRTISTDRRLFTKLVPSFADRCCHVVSVTDPYDRSRLNPLRFLSGSSSIVLTRLSGRRSRPTTSQKI
jgi:hypothetical protein